MPESIALSQRTQQRNFFALLGDFTLWGIAFAGILNPRVLPPAFVSKLGGGPMLIGLAGMLFYLIWHSPQLLFAWWVNRARRKKHYVTIPAIPARFVFLPAGLLIALIGPTEPAVLILLMLGAYAVLAFGDSMCVLAWLDVLGSSLGNKARGRLLGWGEAIVSLIGALFMSEFVRFVLSEEGPTFPDDYALLLLIAGTLLLLSVLSYSLVQEGPSPPPEDSRSLRDYGVVLRRIIREDVRFRRFLGARFVYTLVEIAVPFYIVFATDVLGQDSADAISDNIFVTTVTTIFTALLLGRLSERYGTRIVIFIGTVAAVLHPFLALSALSIGLLGLHLAWVAYSVVNVASLVGFLSWVVEYAPSNYRPIYAGLHYTIIAVAVSAPLVGGVIVENFSYQAVFWVAAFFAVIAFVMLLRMPEPRTNDQASLVEV